MLPLLAALLLGQTVQPVKIINPENQSQGLGNANPLKVSCVSGCSGSGGGGTFGDGGYTIVIQGPGADGGVDWGVTVTGTVGISGSVVVTGPLTDTQLRASPVPVSNSNLDVALSTRTKPADQQHTIIDSSASIAVTGPLTDTQLRASVVPVYVDGGTVAVTQGTSPWTMSGTVTANAGSNLNTSALALSATQTDRTQKTQITDGTRDGTVKTGSTAAAAADTSLVVALSPNSPLPAGSAVLGHVINDTGSTTAVTGNVTVVQGTGTNLHAVLDTTSTTAVTQATGTNLHVVSDATSTTACTQATGTNLHVVSDTTSTTACTQATASNLNMTATQGTSPWVENVSQFGGSNVATGTGSSGAGIPRVTLSNDSSLAANQSVNVSQIGGTTVTAGAGVTSANTQRVVLPTDQNLAVSIVDGGVLMLGQNPSGTSVPVQVTAFGALYVLPAPTVNQFPLNPFLARCNAVRRTNCQP